MSSAFQFRSVIGRNVDRWSATQLGFARRVFARSMSRGLGENSGFADAKADDVRFQIVRKTRGGILAGVRARRGATVSEDRPARAQVRKSKEGPPEHRQGQTRCPTRALFPRVVVPSLHSRSAPSWSAPDRSSCNPSRGFCEHSPKCTRRCLSRVGPVPPSEPPYRAR